MDAIECRIKVNGRSEAVLLRGFFDIHFWARACDEERFRKDVEEVRKTPNMYCFLGGDMCDLINSSDKRFDPKTLTQDARDNLNNLPTKAAEALCDILRPIRHKILFVMEGNHEYTIHKNYSQDITRLVVNNLNSGMPEKYPRIQKIGYCGLVRLVFPRGKQGFGQKIVLFVTHGFGAARREGGKINRMIDCVQYFEADIYWGGHVHGSIFAIPPRLYMSHQGTAKVHWCNKLCFVSGSYLRTYMEGESGYGERVGYPPSQMGCHTVKLIPYRNTRTNGKYVELPPSFEILTKVEMNNGGLE